MTTFQLVILAFAAAGHAIFWVSVVNRLHGIAMNRSVMHCLTLLCGLAVALLPIPVGAAILYGAGTARLIAWTYAGLCAMLSIVFLIERVYFILRGERRGVVLSNHTSRCDLRDKTTLPLAAPGVPSWLARLPGNEVFQLATNEKELVIPRLAPAHEGLRVVHLSDLHMSGRITKAYFEEVVEQVNATRPDLIAVTGDIVERNPCLEWIPDTLGRLRAPGGVFYVRGNHDRKVDPARLQGMLADVGLVHLGERWQQIAVNGAPVILAGNELPWFGPPAELSDCPPRDADVLPLRIVLAHTPDQFGWAKSHDADLVLAGHNHGGQICLPYFGAILAPSLHGVRYAAGAYRSGQTVLHVSRGTACLTPVRWNCPPELAVLVLRAPK